MTTKLKAGAVCATLALSLGLAACGGGGDASGNATGEPSDSGAAGATPGETGGKVAAATLAEGPDVCFRAITKHLGAETKVMEINSFFSAGKDIDGNAREPEGTLTTCTVQYQNPKDPRKVLATRMDTDTGQFSEPQAVELSVMGNAADFKLDDYVIPLGSIDAAALKGIMESQKASLSGVYAKYAWSGVRLESPGAFSNDHVLRLDVEGRLASNDLKENGYASISTDGKKITTNHLLP